MTLTRSLKDLTILTVQDPAEAARQLIGMQLDRGTLWTAVFLMAVLHSMLAGLSNFLLPGNNPFPGLLDVPAVYFFLVGGGLVLIILTIFWCGRAFGGQGAMEDVMVVMVWLQFIRVLVQAVTLVLLLTFPMLAVLVVFAAALISIWILVHFVDQAHRFNSLGKAAGVLIAAFAGMVVGVSILLSLIGVGAVGGGYV